MAKKKKRSPPADPANTAVPAMTPEGIPVLPPEPEPAPCTPKKAKKAKKTKGGGDTEPKRPTSIIKRPGSHKKKKKLSFNPEIENTIGYAWSKKEYDRTPVMAMGYFCDGCQGPIQDDTRFHCTMCNDFDLCFFCFNATVETHQHPIECFEVPESFIEMMDEMQEEGDEGDEEQGGVDKELFEPEVFELPKEQEQEAASGKELFGDLVAHLQNLSAPEVTKDGVADNDAESVSASAAGLEQPIAKGEKKKKRRKKNKNKAKQHNAATPQVAPTPATAKTSTGVDGVNGKKKKRKKRKKEPQNKLEAPATAIPPPPVALDVKETVKKKKRKNKKRERDDDGDAVSAKKRRNAGNNAVTVSARVITTATEVLVGKTGKVVNTLEAKSAFGKPAVSPFSRWREN